MKAPRDGKPDVRMTLVLCRVSGSVPGSARYWTFPPFFPSCTQQVVTSVRMMEDRGVGRPAADSLRNVEAKTTPEHPLIHSQP